MTSAEIVLWFPPMANVGSYLRVGYKRKFSFSSNIISKSIYKVNDIAFMNGEFNDAVTTTIYTVKY